MKALLVGLDATSATIVAGALAARGHEPILVEDASRGLLALKAHRPPLVVVEDPLLDMSAAEFCRRARRCAEGEDAVILVITHSEQELPSVLDAGATDLYVTSLGPAALQTRVLIAERLVAQHARLRDRELRFRRLFDAGVAGVIIWDLDGNFKEANDAFLGMVGYTRQDMLSGKLNWEVLCPLDRLVPDTEERAQLRATGFLPLRERAYVHRDGRHIAALVGSAALHGSTECISYITDVSARRAAEEALRASEEQYRTLFEQALFPKFLFDYETLAFLAVNDAAVVGYGYSRDEFLGMNLRDIQPKQDVTPLAAKLGAAGTTKPGLRRHRKKDGTLIDVELTEQTFALRGRPCGLTIALDVTERHRLESQLRQAQKMEAIGNLAGGVAHDFNNLLSIILSYSEMLAAGLRPDDPMRSDLLEIAGAGQRAEDLTRQLLAFSRQQMLQPRVLDLNAVVGGVAKMLRRLVGEDVEVTVVGDPALGMVTADPG